MGSGSFPPVRYHHDAHAAATGRRSSLGEARSGPHPAKGVRGQVPAAQGGPLDEDVEFNPGHSTGFHSDSLLRSTRRRPAASLVFVG